MNRSVALRYFLGLACLLGYLASAAMRPSLGQETEGPDDVYTSPGFGWSIAWTSPWHSVEGGSLLSGDAEPLLINDTSLPVITGLASDAEPTTCVRQFTAWAGSGEYVPLDDTGEEATDDGRAWVAFRSDGGDMALHVECRRLDPGSTLLGIVQFVSPADAYRDERRGREDLLAALVLPSAPSHPDPAREVSRTTPEPGVIQGSVTDSRGNPLTGVKIVITERDVTTTCKTVVVDVVLNLPCTRDLAATTDSTGHYRLSVSGAPELEYSVEAFHDVELSGESFAFELHPVDGDQSWEGAADGVVEDFLWRISGPQPSINGEEATPEDAGYPGHYYGGSIDVVDASESTRPLVTRYPEGTRIELFLKPRGPMIDGSEGKELNVQLDLEGNWLDHPDAYYGYILDVPVGPYTASAVLVMANGSEVDLYLLGDCPYGASGGFTETTDIDFEVDPIYVPRAVGGIETLRLCVTDLR